MSRAETGYLIKTGIIIAANSPKIGSKRKKVSIQIASFLNTFRASPHARSTYSPVPVLILMRSPTPMNCGTRMFSPVSNIAGL